MDLLGGRRKMGMNKRMRDNIDRLEIKTLYCRDSKKRCPICHRFTLFIKDSKSNIKCIRCNKIIERKWWYMSVIEALEYIIKQLQNKSSCGRLDKKERDALFILKKFVYDNQPISKVDK